MEGGNPYYQLLIISYLFLREMCMKQNLIFCKQFPTLKTFSDSAEVSDSHFTGLDRTEINSKNECWRINKQGDRVCLCKEQTVVEN